MATEYRGHAIATHESMARTVAAGSGAEALAGAGAPVRYQPNKLNREMRDSAGRDFLDIVAARERMKLYCAARPGSPSAVRSPRLLRRGHHWIVILGRSAGQRIAGSGFTVEAALRAFDEVYLAGLRPPVQSVSVYRAARSTRPREARVKRKSILT
jgi:hypothetical protein